MNIDLSGKTALVTGSTAASASPSPQRLAGGRRGRGQRPLAGQVDEAVRRIASGNRTPRCAASPPTSARRKACDLLIAAVPAVDILVNNAGIFEPKPFPEITDEDWPRFFEVNVLTGVRLCRSYLKGMLQRNWGRIVFISSESGVQIPVGDDPLRRHQDGADRPGPRPGRD